MAEPYHKTARPGSGPFADVAKKLRRGDDVATVFRVAIGGQLTDRFMQAASSAELRGVRSEVRKPSRAGRLYAPPRTARATFGRARRGRDTPELARQALAFLLVLSWMRPSTKRTGSYRQQARLWLGKARDLEEGENPGGLAGRCGLSVRELQRYFAVWRSAGLLGSWQPPQSSGCAKGKSGHCFNLYELQVPMPVEAVERLKRYDKAEPATAAAAAGSSQGAPDHRPMPESTQKAAAAFLARVTGPPEP